MRLLNAFVLPTEQTAFEVAYLQRTNRVAWWFGLANLPLMVGVAWLNDTNPGLAVLLTSVVLAGPGLAMAGLQNQRVVSIVYGIASMCMGGLLVHFGQGPMQIEMHFYFFSLLAMLAAFGNPTVILAAAATVTVHHTLIWALLPNSVFNYDASAAVVAVHALFVVVESMVACAIARSFFDNVIGLEKVVKQRTQALDERNAQMRTVLDTVEQGFLTVGPDLRLNSERSAAVARLLGPSDAETLLDYVADLDPTFASWLELGWDEAVNGFLPRDLAIEQLPRQLQVADRTIEVSYQVVENSEDVLLVLTDVTARLASEQAESEQKELLTALEQFLSDKKGFLSFLTEADGLVRDLPNEADQVVVKRKLHTLKGNSAVFGFVSFSRLIHTLETELDEVGGGYDRRMQERVEQRWRWIRDCVERLVDGRSTAIELSRQDQERLLLAVDTQSREVLHDLVASLHLEPGEQILGRLVNHGRSIAERITKDVAFEVEANGVRLERDHLQAFWSDVVHVVRNAVDHGVEYPYERSQAGKPETACVRLSLERVEENLVVEVSDDGAGIDWDALKNIAESRGMPHQTLDDLTLVMFADGVTTRRGASEFSGRGVGLAAVYNCVQELGGTVEVDSLPGEGTTMRFTLPLPSQPPGLSIAV